MRFMLLLPLLLFSMLPVGAQQAQTFYSQSAGDSLRKAGKLAAAITAYKAEWLLHPENTANAYGLACALSVAGQPDSALTYLSRFLKQDTGKASLDLLADPDFVPLHKDRRWAAVEQKVMQRFQATEGHPIHLEAFSLLLLRLGARDQRYRLQLDEVEKAQGVSSKEARALWELQRQADKHNLDTLLAVVESSRWPAFSDVGIRAGDVAFLVLQHSELQYMEKYLPVIREYAGRGEARFQHYAMLYDRIQLLKKLPQLYGTQVQYDEKKKAYALYPVQDELCLPRRRARMGLGSIENYLTEWNIDYRPPVTASLRNAAKPPVDTEFRHGQILIWDKDMSKISSDEDPTLGWVESVTPGLRPYLSEVLPDYSGGPAFLWRAERVHGRQALFFSEPAHMKRQPVHPWDRTVGLTSAVRAGSVLRLPPAFAMDYGYFMADSVCGKPGGCEMTLFFREPRATYRNVLAFRIRGNGTYELVCEAGNPALGSNKPDELVDFRTGFGRANGKSTKYHRELKGMIPAYDKNSWHRVGLTYSDDRLSVWLDDRYLGTVESGLMPISYKIEGVVNFGISDMTITLLEDQLAQLCALGSEKKLITQAIHFDVARAEVRAESLPFLRGLAGWMKEHRDVRFEIGGHTDSTGNAAANLVLSQQRAEAIRTVLGSYGIAPERLVARGYGATKPLLGNSTAADRAINRRVEFVKL